jgi:hypothetical protein
VKQKLSGVVRREPFGAGSKSAHDAVVLVTDAGRYRLQRKNANPFDDPVLANLVGKRIAAQGRVAGPSFVLDDDFTELD